MNWKKLKNEELNTYKYPNLVAEIIYSGYSICTISQCMGYGMRSEDDPLIHGKVFGEIDIHAEEGFNLAHLFDCELEYLFSDKLQMEDGMPVAYARHYERNLRFKKELQIYDLITKVKNRMKCDDEFFLFIQSVVDIDMKDVEYKKSPL